LEAFKTRQNGRVRVNLRRNGQVLEIDESVPSITRCAIDVSP
jgi:hypothetical protein